MLTSNCGSNLQSNVRAQLFVLHLNEQARHVKPDCSLTVSHWPQFSSGLGVTDACHSLSLKLIPKVLLFYCFDLWT